MGNPSSIGPTSTARSSAGLSLLGRGVRPVTIALLLGSGCGPGPGPAEDFRGSGLPVAGLGASARAGAYDAALREAFDVDNALVLLIDPALLPRTGGFEVDDQIQPPVVRALQAAGTVKGQCQPVRPDPKRAPNCAAPLPGYAVRVSDVFQMNGDTVRLFVAAERFRTTGGIGPAGRFAFETGYQLVPATAGWRVVRQGRRVSR